MSLNRALRVAVALLAVPVLVAAQATGGAGSTVETKIAVIDIDRIAAESAAGKKLLEQLTAEQERIGTETQKKQQEIRDLETKANSEILSPDAKGRLARDIERKRTEAQRWLEDMQAEFDEKRAAGEAQFQAELAPVVEAVAKENNIGLILRATPGLTFVLDANLDISMLVVEKLNAAAAAPTGDAANPNP